MRISTIRDRNAVVVAATTLFTNCHTHASLPSLLDLLFSTHPSTSFSSFYSVLHCSAQFFLENYNREVLNVNSVIHATGGVGLLVFHAKHSTRAKHRLLPSSSLPFPSSFQLKLPFHLPTPPLQLTNYRVRISVVQCPQINSVSFTIFFPQFARHLIFGTRVLRGLDTHQHSLL